MLPVVGFRLQVATPNEKLSGSGHAFSLWADRKMVNST